MDVPEFTSGAEAFEAGYLTRLPATEEYRGWMIMTDYKKHRIRVFARERSGTWATPETPQPLLRAGMAGSLRMARSMPSGRVMRFRWVWLPTEYQPREDIVRIIGHRNRTGVLFEHWRYAHRSEWERARAEICRLIDIRIDGRANIDLIED